jgi:hypothetical protein
MNRKEIFAIGMTSHLVVNSTITPNVADNTIDNSDDDSNYNPVLHRTKELPPLQS